MAQQECLREQAIQFCSIERLHVGRSMRSSVALRLDVKAVYLVQILRPGVIDVVWDRACERP
jgi:hypothetical protein